MFRKSHNKEHLCGSYSCRGVLGPINLSGSGRSATASGAILKGSKGKGVNRLTQVSLCLIFFQCSLDPTGFPVYIPTQAQLAIFWQ